MVTVDLDEKAVKKLVKKYIEDTTGKKVKSVSVNVGIRPVGYGMSERDESYFSGITVTINDTVLNLDLGDTEI